MFHSFVFLLAFLVFCPLRFYFYLATPSLSNWMSEKMNSIKELIKNISDQGKMANLKYSQAESIRAKLFNQLTLSIFFLFHT